MRSFASSKFFAPFSWFATLGLLAATGCHGCDQATITCNDAGEDCVLCDAYGCRPADTAETGSGQGQGQGGGNVVTAGTGGSETTGQGGASGTGGGPACDGELTTCSCETTDDCATAGTSCVDGLCVPGCDYTYQCGVDQVCANGACVPACDVPGDCDAGYTCQNGICIVDTENPLCGEAAPCADGETCEQGICRAKCETNAECPEGEICSAAQHACVPDTSPDPVCGENLTCSGMGQQCMEDGYCHYPCTTVDECKHIDARYDACDENICKTDEEINPECTLDNPCEDGKDCISNHCL